MAKPSHTIRNRVAQAKSLLAGLLLGGLGVAATMLLLAPPRRRYVWRLTRAPVSPPPV